MRDVRVSVERVRVAAPDGSVGRSELERQVGRDLRRLRDGRQVTVPASVSAAIARALHDRIAAKGGHDAPTR